jgi:hypothetical protein
MNDARVSPPFAAPEAQTLLAFLDWFRGTLAAKTDGLSAEQLGQRLEPSTMTLGGMLKHLAYVEDWWFNQVFAGNKTHEPWTSVDWASDEDWDWDSAAQDTPGELRALWESEVGVSRRITEEAVAAPEGLDALSVRHSHRHPDQRFSLRWILVHMIEEYARHAGHADLLRESIDGVVGE